MPFSIPSRNPLDLFIKVKIFGTNEKTFLFAFGRVTGAESNQSNRAVHMVTPLQSTTTPIVISSQGQTSNNLAHIIASNLSFT